MLDAFFVNLCIVCTGLFIIHLAFQRVRNNVRTPQIKLWVGIVHGVFGVVLMNFGIPLPGNILIDLRCIPMMVAAQVGGPVSSCIAAGVMIVARLVFYPFSSSSLLNVVVLLAAGIFFGIVARSRIARRYQWTIMGLIFVGIIGSSIGILIHEWKKALAVFVQYGVSVMVATYCCRTLMSYLWKSYDAFLRLREMAERDFLTGLQNTRSFDAEIHHADVKARENSEALSLLMIDIDHFKQVNDDYGHPAGDAVPKEVAQILQAKCRPVDIVSRNGGEEFSVILPSCDSRRAAQVAERIRIAVQEAVFRSTPPRRSG